MRPDVKKIVSFLWVFSAAWLFLRFLLPLGLPFLLGAGIALLAEPMVAFLSGKLRMPRVAAAGIGVTVSVTTLILLLLLVCGLALRELSSLTRILPNLEQTARSGIAMLQDWLMGLTQRLPKSVRPMLQQNIADIFSGGSALLERASQYMLGKTGSLLAHVPEGALRIGTAILAGYMISAKLPRIQQWAWNHLPKNWLEASIRTAKRIRSIAGLWCISQMKLAGVTFSVLVFGFFMLRISYAPFVAFLVALVDAFPVLGTGSILLPWSLICLLQQDKARAIGLLGIYVLASTLRSMLEPKLVGKQLGMDPLITLMAMYAGYRLWGLSGMLLMPLLTATAMHLLPENG